MQIMPITTDAFLNFIGELPFSSSIYELYICGTKLLNHEFLPKFLPIDEDSFVITELQGNMYEFKTYLWVISIKEKKYSIISSIEQGFIFPKMIEDGKIIYVKTKGAFKKEYEKEIKEMIFEKPIM